jgi:5-methyltetrahydrofolate--homocysteine methyltransferase
VVTWTDGGLATALQARGLPPATPVNDWLLDHADDVVAVHRAFVDAGARIVLAGTFRTCPGVVAEWERLADRAVALAREAAGRRAEVWAAVGPADAEAIGALVARVAPHVDGIVLETFVDPAAAAAVLDVVRPLTDRTVVVSLVPRPDGTVGGHEPGPVLGDLVRRGADGVGFNCGTGPAQILAAVARLAVDPGSLWVRPAGDGTPATVAALVTLSARARWVGGCCGVTTRDLSEAHTTARR